MKFHTLARTNRRLLRRVHVNSKCASGVHSATHRIANRRDVQLHRRRTAAFKCRHTPQRRYQKNPTNDVAGSPKRRSTALDGSCSLQFRTLSRNFRYFKHQICSEFSFQSSSQCLCVLRRKLTRTNSPQIIRSFEPKTSYPREHSLRKHQGC